MTIHMMLAELMEPLRRELQAAKEAAKYRELTDDDLVMPTDEYLHPESAMWEPVHPHMVGEPGDDCFRRYVIGTVDPHEALATAMHTLNVFDGGDGRYAYIAPETDRWHVVTETQLLCFGVLLLEGTTADVAYEHWRWCTDAKPEGWVP